MCARWTRCSCWETWFVTGQVQVWTKTKSNSRNDAGVINKFKLKEYVTVCLIVCCEFLFKTYVWLGDHQEVQKIRYPFFQVKKITQLLPEKRKISEALWSPRCFVILGLDLVIQQARLCRWLGAQRFEALPCEGTSCLHVAIPEPLILQAWKGKQTNS